MIAPDEMEALINAQLGYIAALDPRDPHDREARRREVAYLRLLIEQSVQIIRRLAAPLAEAQRLQAELVCVHMLYEMARLENAAAYLCRTFEATSSK